MSAQHAVNEESPGSLVAAAAESLDGVSFVIEDMLEAADVPVHVQARLHALRDIVHACRDRMDRVADMLDA